METGLCSGCNRFFASEGSLTKHLRNQCTIASRRSREQWKRGILNVAKLDRRRNQRHTQDTFRSDGHAENVEPVDFPQYAAMVRVSFVASRKFLRFI